MTGKTLRKIIHQLLLMSHMLKKMNISADISEHNLNHEKQIILLVLPNREGWHYLAVKKLPA